MTRIGWSIDRPDPIHVKTDQDIADLRKEMMDTDAIAIDTETTGLDIAYCTVVFWSISTGYNRYFLERWALPQFKDILGDPRKAWIGSNIKYDAHMLANSGAPLAGDLMCTVVMDRLLDSNREHGLKQSYGRQFGERMADFKQVFYDRTSKGGYTKGDKYIYNSMIRKFKEDPKAVIDYASMDAWSALRLFEELRRQLEETETYAGDTLWDLFIWYEVPFTRALFEMEHRGTQLDIEYLKKAQPVIREAMEDINFQINQIAGKMINVNSPDQLVWLLYDKLGYKVTKKTKKGKPSTEKSAMKTLIDDGCAAAKLITEYKRLHKLVGTYIEKLITSADPNGRIHTNFNQARTATTRLSSSDPNLQNQIRDQGKEFEIRRSFIAGPGYKMIVADYDQLEMFLLAHFSNDEAMIKAIMEGKDIHCTNTELCTGESYDELYVAKQKADNKEDLTDRDRYLLELRHKYKQVGFGLVYEKGPRAFAMDLGLFEKISEEHPDWSRWQVQSAAVNSAQRLINTFFRKIPGAAKFIEDTKKQGAEQKYVETYFGNRRPLPEYMSLKDQAIHLRNAKSRSRKECWCSLCEKSKAEERRAANTVIQGSSADVTRAAMLKIYYDQRLRELDVHMLLQIHDEIVFECPEENVEEALPLIQYDMENPGLDLRVPLRATPHAAGNWIDAK